MFAGPPICIGAVASRHKYLVAGDRRVLQSAMPKLLTNGSKTPKDQVLETLDGTSAKTWKKDATRL